MSKTDSPLRRPIGLSSAIRFVTAVIAVITIGAAVAAGRYVLTIVGVVLLVAVVGLWYRAEAARRAAKSGSLPRSPL